MNPWINYHHLLYFKTIAEEGSVSRAAEKLRLGQPTLSAQLKQFEEAIGVQLFDRHHKRLVLTEQGKVALDYAKTIFQLGGEMIEVLHDRMRPQRPTLQIGALDSVAKQITLRLIKSAYKLARCQVTLLEGKSDELIRELAAHRIDLVLTNFLPPAADAKRLFHRQIAKRNISFYGAPSFKSLRKGFPESLNGQPTILPTFDSKLRSDIDHWSRANDIRFDVIAESQDITVKKLMASEGMGLIPAGAHAVRTQLTSGSLVEIGEVPGIYEELYLVTAQRRISNEVAAELFKTFAG